MTREQILHDLALSRVEIARDAGKLKASLDIPARIQKSIARQPGYWVGGASLIGFLLAFRRRKPARVLKIKTQEKASKEGAEAAKTTARSAGLAALGLTVLKTLFPIIRPILVSYASRAASRFANRLS